MRTGSILITYSILAAITMENSVHHACAQNLFPDGDPRSAFFDNSRNHVLHDLNLPDIPKGHEIFTPPRSTGTPMTTHTPTDPTPLSMSSGIVLSPTGPILTTASQLNNCKYIKIATPNGTQYDARVSAFDPTTDLAIIQAPIQGAWPIRIRSNMPFYHEILEVTGYHTNDSTLQISSGNATEQDKKTGTFTIEQANLNANTGGAVFDGYGDLAGIITRTGNSVQAIPGDTIRRFLYINHIQVPVADGMISPVARVARETPNQVVIRIGCFS